MKSIRFIFSVVTLFILTCPQVLTAQGQSDERRPDFVQLVRRGESAPLRSITPTTPVPRPPRQIPNFTKELPYTTVPTPATSDPVVQDSVSPTVSAAPTTAPILSFDGISDDDNAAVAGGRVVPPDTEGDVGPNHYVQMINLSFEVFDKNGNSIFGPVANNTLWSGFGGVCEELNNGDPIVLYDHLADRWILSQFALGEFSATPGEADGHQCLAISQTPDPTGAYYLYDFIVTPSSDGGFSTFGINDYPKIGIWPDAYYMSVNEFQCSAFTGQCSFEGVAAVAFERAAMLAGSTTARGLKATIPASASPAAFSLQPFHLEGATSPPAGTPGQFVMSFDSEVWGSSGADDGYRIWEFDVDWNNTSNSTFNEVPMVTTSEFDSNLCGFAECVPQSGGELLDTLSQFTMYRAQYRNSGNHQTVILNHSVDANGSDLAGIRWAELRNTGTGWTLHQTGTFAPNDGEHRWMGSAAMDGSGNIALAYSRSSESTFPSVVYTSRSAGDALGQMTGGEVICHAGTGAQVNSSNRWGDYSTISVDPVDDCTFWLTNEYYSATGSFDFETRICAFKLDNCGTQDCTDNDGDGFTTCDGDCDDSDASMNLADADGDGFTTCDGDCDDSDPAINPGAVDGCDGIDNNCDGIDGSDADGDGFTTCDGDCDDSDASMNLADADGDGFTTCDGDCNDSDAAINPGAVDDCDGIDNNCDGIDGSDADGDGFTTCDGDCDDSDASINPGSAEVCGDSIDNDCDGQVDEDCAICVPTHNNERGPRCSDGVDNDCDGAADGADTDCGGSGCESSEVSCTDGLDNDCDGLIDGNDPDCGADCQVTEDPETSCSDGIDNDCDGLIDSDDPDCDPDCQITEDPEVSCSDGIDNDCDGLIDADDPDCSDCVPDGKENGRRCSDGIDNDCDGLIDADDPDCSRAALATVGQLFVSSDDTSQLCEV